MSLKTKESEPMGEDIFEGADMEILKKAAELAKETSELIKQNAEAVKIRNEQMNILFNK